MDLLKVVKRDIIFNVCGEFSNSWFNTNINNGKWEEDTFNIFDYYANNDKIYIDIGAWIGPTVLYNANKYKKIYCFEPDPVALDRLSQNISVNDFNNIVIIDKAISDKNGYSKFGGNGELGNSMSTLLVSLNNSDDFFNDYGRKNQWLSSEERKKDIIEVKTITFETFIEDYKINIDNIGLIKMDIEGGEYIVLPTILDFLKKHKPIFYISLHAVFLSHNQILEIIDLLFTAYDNCYIFDDFLDKKPRLISKKELIQMGYTSIVFASSTLK